MARTVESRRDAIRRMRALNLVRSTDTHLESGTHAVAGGADTVFTWDYEKGTRPGLAKLYEKAKTAQWNATDLPWDLDVDPARVAAAAIDEINPDDVSGTPFASWGPKEFEQLKIESQRWTLSQFLHGEQGALLCTAKLVEAVPWVDAKYYAATQVLDEARHVEVFSRYLDTKLGGHYPVNAQLQALLDDIIADSRWDLAYLGMQIMVEGLALAAFGFIRQLTDEPLLAELLRRVMNDEARHVAFGMLSLKDVYGMLDAAEIRERQEFALEAMVRMQPRVRQQEVWEYMGASASDALRSLPVSPRRAAYQSRLFTKIVPNLTKLGLLDAGDGWLRRRFEKLGALDSEAPDEQDETDETAFS